VAPVEDIGIFCRSWSPSYVIRPELGICAGNSWRSSLSLICDLGAFVWRRRFYPPSHVVRTCSSPHFAPLTINLEERSLSPIPRIFYRRCRGCYLFTARHCCRRSVIVPGDSVSRSVGFSASPSPNRVGSFFSRPILPFDAEFLKMVPSGSITRVTRVPLFRHLLIRN